MKGDLIMLITKKSMVSGKSHTMDIDCTEEQLSDWSNGTLIQDAMPNLTRAEREFIMTGITKEEWELVFSDILE
jgi:hypothetical protein